MSPSFEVPTLDSLAQSSVEVPAFCGEWACPFCKQVCWYNSVPNPKILALQRSESGKIKFRLDEHMAMLQCFQEEIKTHLKSHGEVVDGQ